MLLLLLISGSPLGLGGCADRTTLEPGSRTPATRAVVVAEHVEPKQPGNVTLELEVEHLPPPSELGEGLTTFVVWLTPQGGDQPQNIGQLDYDPGDRTGKLETVTAYRHFRIVVSAESAGTPLHPSDVTVAQGDVDLRSR